MDTATVIGPQPIGQPIRLTWSVVHYRPYGSTAPIEPNGKEADPNWPGFREIRNDDGVVVQHSAIMVVLDDRRQNTGDDDYITYSRARPASTEEAAPVLAEEARRAHRAELVGRVDRELDRRQPDQLTPLRDVRSEDERHAFYRHLHSLPHVRLDPDHFRLVFDLDTQSLRIFLDPTEQVIYLEHLTFQTVHGLPVTPERRALYDQLTEAFGEAR